MSVQRILLAVLGILAGVDNVMAADLAVPLAHYNRSRTGANVFETSLNTTNVKDGNFGLLYSRPLDGQMYAQPLIATGVTTNQGVRNLVICATMQDSVFAYDADDPTQTKWIWKSLVGTPIPIKGTVYDPDADGHTPGNIDVEVGVLSTPAIDPTGQTLSVVCTVSNSECSWSIL